MADGNLQSKRNDYSASEFPLPDSYERNDSLRAFFTGNEKLPDTGALIAFATEGISRTGTSASHTERVGYDSALRQRVDGLARVLGRILANIQETGQAEIIPQVSSRLEEIRRIQEAQHNPVPPIVLMSRGENGMSRIRVLGDSFVPYFIESSSDLKSWNAQPNEILDGAQLNVDSRQSGQMFIRVREGR